MTNIDVKITKHINNTHAITEILPGNSISDLILSLRIVKESTNKYLTKLVEEDKLKAQTGHSQSKGNPNKTFY